MSENKIKLVQEKNTPKKLGLADLSGQEGQGPKFFDGNFSMISNVKVHLEVYVGDAELTVDELFGLQRDSVIPLSQAYDAPLSIKLDGKVVALGMLVVVDENFGIQITEIKESPAFETA